MPREYPAVERRANNGLSEEQVEEIVRIVTEVLKSQQSTIAKLAAKEALDLVAADVGRGVIQKLYYLVGATVIAVLLWAGAHGIAIK